MNPKASASIYEDVLLRSDNGSEHFFRGRIFSESVYYDEESSILTRLRLFLAEDGTHVYSIVSGSGKVKSRRYYVVMPEGEFCRMSDGVQSLVLPVDTLFAAVFGLCGLDPTLAEELRPAFEESLRAANG